MRIKLVVLYLLVLSLPVTRADNGTLITWVDRGTDTEYQPAATMVTATVRHPFKVTQFITEKADGTLRMDPLNIRSGFSLNLALEANAWNSSFPRLQSLWTDLFPTAKNEKIELKATSGRLVEHSAKSNHFTLDLNPEIRIRGITTEPPLYVVCDRDGAVLKCTFTGTFPLTDLNIPVPRYLGVFGKDKVEVEGEIAWVPISERAGKKP